MNIIYLKHPLNVIKDFSPTVLALGYFDGVHLGHQKVIQTALNIAKEKGVTTSVMTFHPHPREVLQRLKEPMNYLTPLKDKLKKLEALGVDTVFVVEFTLSFAKLTPQQFVDQYLIGLNAIHIVAGFDYTYGTLGKGTMETLPFHSRGKFETTVVKKLEKEEEKVSSTKIRELLATGTVEEIPKYLGECYSIKGVVVDGDKRGRTIGFPTANVKLSERYYIPALGVYAVKMLVNGKWYEGVCNLGKRPTFHNENVEPTIEVHLFSFHESIYGEEVEVKWVKHIRDEQKFKSVDDLIAQINRDKEQARAIFLHEDTCNRNENDV